MRYVYYAGDGTLLRDSDPDFHRLEIYRGKGKWEPYPTTQAFYTGHDRLTDEEAQQAMAEFDGQQPGQPGRGQQGQQGQPPTWGNLG
jgi:hypothetical protein